MFDNDDFKAIQDDHLRIAKELLLEEGKVYQLGFVFTQRIHLRKLQEAGWGACLLESEMASQKNPSGDDMVCLTINLSMDWERMFEAVVRVIPEVAEFLRSAIDLAKNMKVDEPYMRTMRPFLETTNLDEKDIISMTMKSICELVDASAAMHISEAYLKTVPMKMMSAELGDLSKDDESVEIIVNSIETHDFIRMLHVPIFREPAKPGAKRDSGRVIGIGEVQEHLYNLKDKGSVITGRMVRFLKPPEVPREDLA